jgi:hypothetical protein
MAAEQPPSEAGYSGVFDLPAEGDGLTGSERLLTIKVHQQLGTMERSGGRLRQPEE